MLSAHKGVLNGSGSILRPRLQRRRKALDLTREELAQKIGCSVSALRKIETNMRHPSKQLAELLACGLNIPMGAPFVEQRLIFLRVGESRDALPDLNDHDGPFSC